MTSPLGMRGLSALVGLTLFVASSGGIAWGATDEALQARIRHLVAHLALRHELAVYDVENQIEQIGVSAIPTLIEGLRSFRGYEVKARCDAMLHRLARYRAPFTSNLGYGPEAVEAWERYWQAQQKPVPSAVPPGPASLNRQRVDLLLRIYIDSRDRRAESYAIEEIQRYEWRDVVDFLIEAMQQDRFAARSDQVLGFFVGYDPSLPVVTPGESRAERDNKISSWTRWWEQAATKPGFLAQLRRKKQEREEFFQRYWLGRPVDTLERD